MRAQACSWPGWLDSTISTTHLTCSSVELFDVEGQQPLDDDLALVGVEDAAALERQQQAAAVGSRRASSSAE